MKKPIFIKEGDVEKEKIPFAGKEGDAGWWQRIVYPKNVDTKGIVMGIIEVNPGFAAHGWHTHTVDKKQNKQLGIEIEVNYPKKDNEYIFEEYYYIQNGNGIIQWEDETGKIEERDVKAGDIIFFPRGVTKHQLFNNGNKKIKMIYGGGPLTESKVKPLKN